MQQPAYKHQEIIGDGDQFPEEETRVLDIEMVANTNTQVFTLRINWTLQSSPSAEETEVIWARLFFPSKYLVLATNVEISRRVIKMIQFWVMKATGKKKQYAVDQRHPRWYLALANSCSSPTPIIQETQLSFSMLQIWAGDPFDHTLIPAQLAESSELCRRKWQKETKWGGEKETELDLRMLWGSTCLGTMLNKHQ